MDGEQLPKATMTNFIKKITKKDVTQPYVQKLMDLSKEFITRVSNKSLQICIKKGKKNINVQHLQLALKNYGMQHHLQALKQLENQIKVQNANKKQAMRQQQENIRKQLLEQREQQKSQRHTIQYNGVLIRQTFSEIEKLNSNLDSNLDQQNYEQIETVQECS